MFYNNVRSTAMFVTDKKPNDLYRSPDISVMKSRMVREERVARMG